MVVWPACTTHTSRGRKLTCTQHYSTHVLRMNAWQHEHRQRQAEKKVCCPILYALALSPWVLLHTSKYSNSPTQKYRQIAINKDHAQQQHRTPKNDAKNGTFIPFTFTQKIRFYLWLLDLKLLSKKSLNHLPGIEDPMFFRAKATVLLNECHRF